VDEVAGRCTGWRAAVGGRSAVSCVGLRFQHGGRVPDDAELMFNDERVRCGGKIRWRRAASAAKARRHRLFPLPFPGEIGEIGKIGQNS